MYDELYIKKNSSQYYLNLKNGGNLTIYVSLFKNNTGNHGTIVANGPVILNGNFHFYVLNLAPGNWEIPFINYNGYLGNSSISIYSAPSCYNISHSFQKFYTHNATIYLNVTGGSTFTKGSRNWVAWAFVGCFALAFIFVVFTITTCIVSSWRKLIWYPPY